MHNNPQQNYTQMVLDLPHRTAYHHANFFVSNSNQSAAGWIDIWPDWPAPALILNGPKKSGTTHLAKVWQHNAGAQYVAASDADFVQTITAYLESDGDAHIIIDDGDCIPKDAEKETVLFHLYNHIKSKNLSLLIATHAPNWRERIALPDLASRMGAAPMAMIDAPDDALLLAVLKKHFEDRQLHVDADLLHYLLPRVERSFAFIDAFVEKIDAASLEHARPVTVPLMRDTLQQMTADEYSPYNPEA